MAEVEEKHAPWRGWHVIARFLPMTFLGVIFLVLGASPAAPHRGPESFGIVFVWLGVVLIGASILGMIFTKCPTCYQARWIVCVQEPDVVRHRTQDRYHRQLSFPEDES